MKMCVYTGSETRLLLDGVLLERVSKHYNQEENETGDGEDARTESRKRKAVFIGDLKED
jgi:hypothetical protein